MTEKRLQSEIAKWLRSQGCFVMITTIGPGIPQGTPDLFFCQEGFYGFIEVKDSKNASFQPLQKIKIDKFMEWSWCKVVYPENWDEIKSELKEML